MTINKEVIYINRNNICHVNKKIDAISQKTYFNNKS